MKYVRYALATIGFGLILATASCQGGLGGSSNSHLRGETDSSEPVNNSEGVDYKRSILRCHKTGGTRIVKVEGELRCY